MSRPPAHWIRGNADNRLPSRFVFLDTEASQQLRGEAKVQTWRLAVTAADWRPTATQPWRPTDWRTHRTPAELWAYVDAFTRPKRRTVLVAHNLAYDLRISDAFSHLGALGWSMHRLSVHDRSVNAVMRRDGRTLVLADSMAWLPMGLERVAGLVGQQKVELPAFDDTDDKWEHRCRVDVTILRAAMLDLVQWVDDDKLGNWQRTGAAQAWATWRHRFYTHRVLVHDDAAARVAEAAATYTGRCEAWQWGNLRRGPYIEYDLPLAYPTIAAETPIPIKLLGHLSSGTVTGLRRQQPGRASLCRASVTTDAPTLPHSIEGRTCWPVGTFDGWWWDVELLEAARCGAQVTVAERFTYATRPALAEWARWIIDLVQTPPEGFSAVRQAAAKHMARALIGRFATRYVKWEPAGEAIPGSLPLEYVYDVDTKQLGRRLTVGAESYVGMQADYGADACIAVMGYIMATCRVRLWRIMQAAGLDHVVYVDTDSAIVDRTGAELLEALHRDGTAWGLRAKVEHPRITVLGPRQLITAGSARIAGVPKGARRIDGNTWAGETWSGLLGDLARGQAASVTIKPGAWKVTGTDHRRVHLPGGRTAPLVVPWHVPASDTG